MRELEESSQCCSAFIHMGFSFALYYMHSFCTLCRLYSVDTVTLFYFLFDQAMCALVLYFLRNIMNVGFSFCLISLYFCSRSSLLHLKCHIYDNWIHQEKDNWFCLTVNASVLIIISIIVEHKLCWNISMWGVEICSEENATSKEAWITTDQICLSAIA